MYPWVSGVSTFQKLWLFIGVWRFTAQGMSHTTCLSVPLQSSSWCGLWWLSVYQHTGQCMSGVNEITDKGNEKNIPHKSYPSSLSFSPHFHLLLLKSLPAVQGCLLDVKVCVIHWKDIHSQQWLLIKLPLHLTVCNKTVSNKWKYQGLHQLWNFVMKFNSSQSIIFWCCSHPARCWWDVVYLVINKSLGWITGTPSCALSNKTGIHWPLSRWEHQSLTVLLACNVPTK